MNNINKTKYFILILSLFFTGLIVVLSLLFFLLPGSNLFFRIQTDNPGLNGLSEEQNENNINDTFDLLAKEPLENKFHLPQNLNIPKPIRMLFFGDMMLDRHVGELINKKGLDHIFEKLDEADFFANYDLVSANLEGTVTNSGEHYAPDKLYDFAFHPDLISGLKKYNFNFFNLANNHFDDQGEAGMDETRENLDRLGFNYSGDRNGIVSDHSKKIMVLKNKKIGLIGLSALGNALDLVKAVRIVSELASTTDLVIVNIHWGEEYQLRSNKKQQELAHRLINADADIIIGHHPHVVQEIEVYKNKLIFYSLGNFIFDQYFSKETQEGLAVEIIFDKGEVDHKTHLFKSSLSQLELE